MGSRRESSVSKASVKKTEGIWNNVEIILKNTNSVDRISHLPDDVIMHIFSLLKPRDIVATCTLGKTWARISSRLKPNPEHYIERNVDEFLESYKNQGVRVMSYSFSIQFPAQIDDWLQLIAENSIYVLHICFGSSSLFSFRTDVSVSDSLVVLVLQNCSLKGLTSSLRLHSLQELVLERVELSDLCSSFVSVFYNIKTLRLRYISDLYHFCFGRLDQLKLVEISSVYSMSSENRTSSLPSPWFSQFPLSYSDNYPCRIIDHDTLQVLHLSYVDEMACPVINTPRLHTFKFGGNAFEPFLFTMNTGRTSLRKISFEFSETCPIDGIWFVKLGLFVRKYGQDGVLSLRFVKNCLVCKSLGKFRRLPMCKLKHLKVKDAQIFSPLSCKDLINGLLWGFRPESLSMIFTEEPRKYIKVIQKHFQNKKGSSRKCCGSARSRCWRCGLKHAEFELSSELSKKIPSKNLFKLNIKFQWGED